MEFVKGHTAADAVPGESWDDYCKRTDRTVRLLRGINGFRKGTKVVARQMFGPGTDIDLVVPRYECEVFKTGAIEGVDFEVVTP